MRVCQANLNNACMPATGLEFETLAVTCRTVMASATDLKIAFNSDHSFCVFGFQLNFRTQLYPHTFLTFPYLHLLNLCS